VGKKAQPPNLLKREIETCAAYRQRSLSDKFRKPVTTYHSPNATGKYLNSKLQTPLSIVNNRRFPLKKWRKRGELAFCLYNARHHERSEVICLDVLACLRLKNVVIVEPASR